MSSEAGPVLPAPVAGLPKYIAEHPEQSMVEIMDPYRRYEAYLRTAYAQDRQNPMLSDPYINVVPLFTDDTKHITTRARNLAAESEEEKSRYIMSLPDDKRRPHGSPATVANVDEFRKNFNIFSESSLVDMDWNNVVAAGSSVVNTLLPVPKEYNSTKRKLREYYHEKVSCPAKSTTSCFLSLCCSFLIYLFTYSSVYFCFCCFICYFMCYLTRYFVYYFIHYFVHYLAYYSTYYHPCSSTLPSHLNPYS
jgi:hypothetical protein